MIFYFQFLLNLYIVFPSLIVITTKRYFFVHSCQNIKKKL